jgi:hypothetical protein
VIGAFYPFWARSEVRGEFYREPGWSERDAVECAVADLGGRCYTGRDATRVLLGYADLTSTNGTRRPGPLARPARWRQSFALKLALAIRGVL